MATRVRRTRARRSSKESGPAVFRAIADPTRRAILDGLAAEPRTVKDIARDFAVSRPAISKHLRLLRAASLVSERRRGQSRVYELTPQPLRHIDEWLNRYRLFWSARLMDLKQFVESRQETLQRKE